MSTTLFRKDSHFDVFFWIKGWANFEPTTLVHKKRISFRRIQELRYGIVIHRGFLRNMIFNVPLICNTVLQKLLAGDLICDF